jgi:hypothetical protein
VKYVLPVLLSLTIPAMAQTPPPASPPAPMAPPSVPDQMRNVANQLGNVFLLPWAKSYEDLAAQNETLKADNDRLGRAVDAMTRQGHVAAPAPAAPPPVAAQPPHPPSATETAPEPHHP